MSRELISEISESLGISSYLCFHLLSTAPRRYKVYAIPKKNGKGARVIAQPSKGVKKIQRWFSNTYLQHLPIHERATAYKTGSSILLNAQFHINSNCILKMDFENFFNSITWQDVYDSLNGRIPSIRDEQDLKLICDLLTWQPKGSNRRIVSVGAPSSPCLSNVVMYEFDQQLFRFCQEHLVEYTRYADDLVFSCRELNALKDVEKHVHELIREVSPSHLHLNQSKRRLVTRKNRRRVTGLILSNQDYVSLGRSKKREIRSKMWHFINGHLDEEEIGKLSGWLAFARDIEPGFLVRLAAKYGRSALQSAITGTLKSH